MAKSKQMPLQLNIYNVEEDVEQTTNLYNDYPEIVAEMKAILELYKIN